MAKTLGKPILLKINKLFDQQWTGVIEKKGVKNGDKLP
jgi:hypothetical protein